MAVSRVQWVTCTIIVILLALIGWRVLSMGLADHWAGSDPDRALRWQPDHALALVTRAERQADAGQWQAAAASARAALAADPLQSRGYRVLAEQADAAGDTARAAALFQIAARRLPRDLISQRWLFNHHISAGRLAEALPHLDAMLRAKPELAAAMGEQLALLATLESTQRQFVALLASRPPWRVPTLNQILREAQDLDGLTRFMQLLETAPVPIEPELAPRWEARLMAAQRFETAYLHWVAGLPLAQQARIGNVFNGDFELPISNSGFDWRAGPVAGAQVETLAVASGPGLAVRIAFDDQRVPFQQLRQWLVLAPAHYRLQGRLRADDLRSERGLAWSLRCVESGTELAQTEPVHGTRTWQSFTVDFEVPELGCQAQELVLVHLARIASEQQIGGQVWFDDLAIQRRPRP